MEIYDYKQRGRKGTRNREQESRAYRNPPRFPCSLFPLSCAILLAALTVSITRGDGPAATQADLAIENARIWSPDRVGFAEFAAVRGGRFEYVGPRDPARIGPSTRRIDAGGRPVIPGLIDAHIHMLSGGKLALQLQLRDAKDRPDLIRRVQEWTQRQPPGRWILGGRWSVETWSDPQPPTRAWIDPVTGDHPLFLARMDGHSALVNSLALKQAGITATGPPDPPDGTIDRDPKSREPTGILRESAMSLVATHIPGLTIDEKVEALRRAATTAIAAGITAVGDIPNLEDLPAYEHLGEQLMPVRFYLYPTALDWTVAVPAVRRFHARPGRIEIRGLKMYMDGSLGSRTAYMHEPYLGNDAARPGWRGLLREGADAASLKRNLSAARDARLQPIAHAIGDEANHALLDAYEAAYGRELASARARIEHAQHLLPADIDRIGRLGVIASMQPFHKADDGRYAESYVGAQRSRSSYAFRSLLDAGAIVAFGSDWPVVTLNPLLGVEAAVTARTLDGKTWQEQQAIPLFDALRAYTAGAAYALFAEDDIGRIAPGCRADFVILNRSIARDETQWNELRPREVWMDGQRVYP